MSEQEPISKKNTEIDLSEIPDEEWQRAERTKAEIDRLLQLKNRTEADVVRAAEELGVSKSWLYQLIRRYRTEGSLTSLVKRPPSGGKGKSRIEPEAENLIQEVIEEFYLTVQKPKAFLVVREIERRCRSQNIKPPAGNTIRSRLRSISSRTAMKRRESGHKARDRFDPVVGEFPKPQWPLSVIQMDHTVSDIVIVDEVYREPIGRASCTAAIDVYSRAILGFYLSLEAPSAMTVGLCLAYACAPKVKWLKERGIEADWPMWGKPDVLHVDNGADFRSEALRRGCLEHDIQLQHRPIKHPRYGGTVERVFRTLMQELHAMPGATFSNIAARGGYNSEKHATMTLAELERALVLFITGVYHERPHGSTLLSPRKAFELGIHGDGKALGRGTPMGIKDEQRFLIDFLPLERRSIQKYGFVWDHIRYYDDVLRPYIDQEDKRKFIIRRDPRDISKIYFFCPETNQYHAIPYRNLSRPSMSLWEVKAARERLRRLGEEDLDEDKIFRSFDMIEEEITAAKGKTKTARRATERKRQAKISSKRNPIVARPSNQEDQDSNPAPRELEPHDDQDTFDDIEHW